MKIVISIALLGFLACTHLDPGPTPIPGTDVVAIPFGKVRVRFQPPSPPYPPKAKAAKIDGVVKVELTFDPTGVPTEAHAISGPAELFMASENHAMNWRFYPVNFQGSPRYARFTLPLVWRVH